MNQQIGARRQHKELPLSVQQAKAVMVGRGEQEVRTFCKGILIDCDHASRREIHALIDRANGATLTLEGGVDFGLVVIEDGQRVFVETNPVKVLRLLPLPDVVEAGDGVL